MTATLRILGIDPGSRATGWAVIDAGAGKLACVDCGVIVAGGGPFPERLERIFDGLSRVMATHQPAEVAVEQVFVSRSADSALKLGQARGAAICAAVKAGLPVGEYAARRIKQAVVGTGSADKHQVAHMVRALVGLREAIAADAADALAVAVCHAHTLETERRRVRQGYTA